MRVLLLGALVSAAILLTACSADELGQLLEEVLVQAATQQAQIDQEQSGGRAAPPANLAYGESSGLWAVYFTNPATSFDDVTTGGVEENLIALIDQAQVSIDLAVFEFNLENVAQALINAHNRGVRVRIVYDDEHTEDDPQMEELIDAGIPATPDQRSAYMHNKFFVIDRQIVWTGSTNMTINDAYRNNNNAIVIISPELAENYTAEFEEMFNGEFGPTSPANTPYPGVAVGDMWVETYFSPEDDVMTQLISLVSEAQSSIHFMAFSFTDEGLANAMLERAAAGVDVRGVFETRGANTEYSSCPPLLRAGLDVRLDSNPRTLHHKVIIIDGRIVATGSFNYSSNATTSNDENLLIVHNPAVAALYEEEFNRIMGSALLPQGGECLSGSD
ncbi:MAG: phospholipase D-like domain-containing protein [Anaerolineae bacterium]